MRDVFKVTTAGYLVVFLIVASIFSFQYASAELSQGSSMSSDNFKVLDAQHGSFGAISSSSSGNFILLGNIGDVAIGSSSITDFKLNSGFLYYPKVIAPILNSATAGVNQVALAWTGASAFQGLSVSGYDVCLKSSGGAYACSNVGNTTSSTQTNLTADVAYTFQIEALDALNNIIAISNELSATPTAPAPTPTPTSTPPPQNNNGGGGGGGGGFLPPPSGGGAVKLIGISYPLSTVFAYLNEAVVSSIKTGPTGAFQITVANVPADATIGIGSQDSNGRKSITVSYPISSAGSMTISNILVPTTIELSSYQLARGDILRIFGQGPAVSEVDVHVFSKEIINKLGADNNGSYTLSFNTQVLPEDSHTAKSRAILADVVSPFSEVKTFIVGNKPVNTNAQSTDLNHDGRINIIDFSVLMYWWNTKSQQGLTAADINGDGKVNIIDFSILLFQWTG